jgi:hypothetical protein
MQQRVGLARAFATQAPILLMDEPFSALDPLIRTHLQDELLKLQSELKRTIIFVSHDLDEALKIGNRIAIMQDGRIVQAGTPQDIVLKPVNDYVAEFVQHMNPLNVMTGETIMRKLKRGEKVKTGKGGSCADAAGGHHARDRRRVSGARARTCLSAGRQGDGGRWRCRDLFGADQPYKQLIFVAMPDGKPAATFPGIAGVFSQCRTENRLPLFLALLLVKIPAFRDHAHIARVACRWSAAVMVWPGNLVGARQRVLHLDLVAEFAQPVSAILDPVSHHVDDVAGALHPA